MVWYVFGNKGAKIMGFWRKCYTCKNSKETPKQTTLKLTGINAK